jgi:hypothetical protein
MKRNVLRWLAVAALALGSAGFGVARAQTQPAASGAQPVRRVSSTSLSPAQQQATATQLVDEMSTLRRTVNSMLDRATQEHDIIKVNCLNDKLTQIDVTIRSAREHLELLQTAIGLNNDGQRNHEFALMLIYQQRTRALDVEARQCVGEDAAGFGERTEVSVRTAATIPDGELDLIPGTIIDIFIPPTLSPVR